MTTNAASCARACSSQTDDWRETCSPPLPTLTPPVRGPPDRDDAEVDHAGDPRRRRVGSAGGAARAARGGRGRDNARPRTARRTVSMASSTATMDLGLTGKSALVGGGARGLGRATAEVLAAEGAAVAI